MKSIPVQTTPIPWQVLEDLRSHMLQTGSSMKVLSSKGEKVEGGSQSQKRGEKEEKADVLAFWILIAFI